MRDDQNPHMPLTQRWGEKKLHLVGSKLSSICCVCHGVREGHVLCSWETSQPVRQWGERVSNLKKVFVEELLAVQQ